MTAQNNLQPTVDVTGEGIVRVVPDEVTISVQVENIGNEVKLLKTKNDQIVNDVLQTIKRMGIEDKDVQTEYVRLSKNYQHNTKTYNYSANQTISIYLKDLQKYESLMDGLMASGINRIDGISFSASKEIELKSQARKKAIENAVMKANEYVGVLNQTIGKAVSISELQNATAPQPMYRAMAMQDGSAGAKQTLAPGEIEIRANVNVRFVLK
ncbi:MAG: hypothetical protein ACJAUR_000367 [Ulvibacter sp.]|jgi:uncharacterized protein YggE|tara:strand:- start:2233 stop:2868 length:636 start_codon:yes stop_codon:yes gene_type:complete